MVDCKQVVAFLMQMQCDHTFVKKNSTYLEQNYLQLQRIPGYLVQKHPNSNKTSIHFTENLTCL
jgi:hypothetical protein